ncbi:MAG TPA: DMT family transporter [Pseudonocardiaceae bacterium]
MMLLVAFPAAIGAAFCFGLTGALQHAAATEVSERAALRPGLLVDLAHRPMWLASLLVNIGGTVLQLVALDTGPIVLVQPTLVSGLLFGMSIRSLMHRSWPPRMMWLGGLLCVAGLSVFLVLAKPTGGTNYLTLQSALPLGIGLAVVMVICMIVASRYTGEVRILALALSAGVFYGVTAGILKLVVGLATDGGLVALFTHWPVYALMVCGPAGFLLNQNAYQSDKVLARSLAVITVTDPLVGIGIGVLWLNEQLQSGVGPIIGQILALGTLVTGVWLVSHSAAQLLATKPEDGHRPDEGPRPAAGPTGHTGEVGTT